MKRLLYPLIASALVTIVPFLLTFEKGQDIVRGLFGYEYFSLLLFLVWVRNKATKKFLRIILLILLTTTLFVVSWIDLHNLLAIKGWNTSWYGILPFITSGLSLAMVYPLKSFKFNTVCFILFVSLILHLEAYNRYAAQPLAQFPTIDYLERIAPKPVQRNMITEEFRKKYTVTDSVTITREFVDATRNNVVILVESWGVPLDIERFDNQLKIFDGLTSTNGIHNRMYSRTRTAEREDLIYTISRDSATKQKDTTFLPKVFNDLGYQTTFLFGGDSLEHYRFKYIKNIGFNDAIYGNGLNDQTMISKINSILADSSQKHFIVWTTIDTKFPMSDYSDIYYNNAKEIDLAYSNKLSGTLTLIANFARKHTEVRFIIQGDHNPILSPIKFQEIFYKRWIPFIVLN